MRTDPLDAVLDSDLPLVRGLPPWPVRVLFGGIGVLALVGPLWQWHPVLWPPNVGSLIFGAIAIAVGALGLRFLGLALSGAGEEWDYAPGLVLVRRRAWGRETVLRLSATNVAEVRILPPTDPGDTDAEWRVQVVPKPGFSQLAVAAAPRGVFDAGGHASADYAARVRQALCAHLGI